MPALLFENLATLPIQLQSLRALLERWADAIDVLIDARVPRRRPRQGRSKIKRHRGRGGA